MATENRHSGTLRSDYEAVRTRSDDLRPLTADTDILLHRLIRASREIPYRDADGREGTLTPLLENHVLTVLADIRRKRLADYGSSFADAQGTAAQARYLRKLEQEAELWRARLEAYLHTAFAKGIVDTPAVRTARELRDRLKSALQGNADANNRSYYRILRTVTAIQENADRYWQQAAESGDTEPALALLVAWLKNYAGIAEAFNRRFAVLPELYLREVLHAAPAKAVPDNAYLIVTPAGKGFTLKRGTAFATGTELVYKTRQAAYISPMRCVSVQTLHTGETGALLQTLDFEHTDTSETLFSGGEELRTGWQIESPMLVLEEGRRTVEIRFLLSEAQPDRGAKQGFSVEYATAKGWTEGEASCELSEDALTFRFTIEREGIAPTPCSAELHGTETARPTLRILTTHEAGTAWADGLHFTDVRMNVQVSGIRNFTFLGALGEADTSQAVAPFGVQAERGSGFIFGNREAGMKPLKGVTLTGTWRKLPETEREIDALYGGYGVKAGDFRVRSECQKNGEWQEGESRPLFRFDDSGNLKQARFTLDFSMPHAAMCSDTTAPYGYTRDKDGFFRISLESPEIGFGSTAYRNRFIEVMVHNSRCKEKEIRPIPQEPSIPLLAEVEMAYEAEMQVSATASAQEFRMTPIALTARHEALPREGMGRLLPCYPASNLIYFAFTEAGGERQVRIYMDLALPEENLPFYNPDPDAAVCIRWQYWNGAEWKDIPAKEITAEETAGLTQSGFVEIAFGNGIRTEWLDSRGRLWLRAFLTTGTPLADSEEGPAKWQDADVSACLALRGVWSNCIPVTADGGDGTSLPAGTIQGPAEEDPRIGSVTQPLPGFGGIPAGTDAQSAAHQTARFTNRHRAVTQRDYERILLEHYPEVAMAKCLTLPRTAERERPELRIIVFSRAEENGYYLTAPWRLNEMGRTLKRYAPACAELKAVNPLYERVVVECHGTFHFGVEDQGKAEEELTKIVEDYFMPWRKKGMIPTPGRTFSVRELRSRLMNHEDLQRVTALLINGRDCLASDGADDCIRGREPWSVLIPEASIQLTDPDDGIGGTGIGSSFIVG